VQSLDQEIDLLDGAQYGTAADDRKGAMQRGVLCFSNRAAQRTRQSRSTAGGGELTRPERELGGVGGILSLRELARERGTPASDLQAQCDRGCRIG
jgi:hypothetical protein